MRTKKAFTVIEISLFLALSGLLMVGIIGGASNSIARQRYNDSVNSFVEFLKNIYSETTNVQNQRTSSLTNSTCSIASTKAATDPDNTSKNPGRSDCAIYGKLVVFGEAGDSQTIHVYDVVGEVLPVDRTTADYVSSKLKTSDSVLASLDKSDGVKADVVGLDSSGNAAPALGHYTYTPEWQARIETTAASGDTFKGAVLIVRSPLSGTVHTYVYSGTTLAPSTLFGAPAAGTSTAVLSNNLSSFSNSANLDFCIGSDDYSAASSHRRNVRILADGNNITAVELVAADSGDNKCE